MLKKSNILIFALTFIGLNASVANAQNDILWKKNFGGSSGDIYYSVTAVSDGIVAVGYSSSFDGDWTDVTGKGGSDAIIVKYDNNGTVVWKKNFDGGGIDFYSSVTAVSDGIVAVGHSSSFGNGDWTDVTGKGYSDAIIVKYDNNGTVVWKKNFGGSELDLYSSVTAVSNGIVAVGESSSFGNGDWTDVTGKGGSDAIIVKYDNNGTVVWKKNFGGGSGDYYYSVTAVSDGIVAVGYSSSFGNGDWTDVTGKDGYDAIIVKYDDNGTVVWKKNFGGNSDDYYRSVTAVSDGIVAVGNSSSESFGNGDWTDVTGKGYSDAIIVKYDNNGTVVWKKNFGGGGNDFYYSVTAVSDGIVAVGHSYPESFGNGDWTDVTGKGGDDAIIVKYNNNGTVVWKKNFGGSGSDTYYSVTAVSDGIVAVGDSHPESFGNGDWTDVKGGNDAIIVKYEAKTSGVVGAGLAPAPQVAGYYSILGQKLLQEPESGMYIIIYDNGKAEKVLK